MLIKIIISILFLNLFLNNILAVKLIITCSGGGIRASTGCFVAIKKLKSWPEIGGTYRTFERYGISGGSWGLIFEEHLPDVLTFKNAIHNVINTHNTWGPRSPSIGGNWHDKWANDIKTHVLIPSGVLNDPKWKDYVLLHPKLMITAARYEDRKEPLEHCDFGLNEFYCPLNDNHIPNNLLKIEGGSGITLSDVLTYSSSAWATPKVRYLSGAVPKKMIKKDDATEFKLYDGGIFINIPILNPIVKFAENDNLIIISLDFSNTKFNKKKGKDELSRVRKVKKYCKDYFTGNTLDKFVEEFENQQCHAVCDDEDRTVYLRRASYSNGKYFKLIHIPLYGHTMGWDIYHNYPTRLGSDAITWNQQMFDDFIDEWSDHLDNVKDKIIELL